MRKIRGTFCIRIASIVYLDMTPKYLVYFTIAYRRRDKQQQQILAQNSHFYSTDALHEIKQFTAPRVILNVEYLVLDLWMVSLVLHLAQLNRLNTERKTARPMNNIANPNDNL